MVKNTQSYKWMGWDGIGLDLRVVVGIEHLTVLIIHLQARPKSCSMAHLVVASVVV